MLDLTFKISTWHTQNCNGTGWGYYIDWSDGERRTSFNFWPTIAEAEQAGRHSAEDTLNDPYRAKETT